MLDAVANRLKVESLAGIHVVRLVDASIVTEEEIRGVVDQLASLLEGEGATRLLLNFAEVRWMSSSLIAHLIKLQRSLQADGGGLKLCCLPPEVLPVFTWCLVPFAIYADEREAMDSLGSHNHWNRNVR